MHTFDTLVAIIAMTTKENCAYAYIYVNNVCFIDIYVLLSVYEYVYLTETRTESEYCTLHLALRKME